MHATTAWFVLGAGALLVLTNAGAAEGEAYISDQGLVQNLTLLVLVVAAATAGVLAFRFRENRFNLALLACGMTIYAGREHDLHRLSFLPEHFTRWQFYTMDAVTTSQKIGFGLVICGVIAVVGLFLYRMTGPFLRDFRSSQPWAILALVWLVSLTISQISDRTWLNDTFAGRAFEEITELVAAGLALSVVCLFPREMQPPKTAASANSSKPGGGRVVPETA